MDTRTATQGPLENGEIVEMSALGRPFTVGMLYDCRKDSIIYGLNLWSEEDLKKHTHERPQHFNNFATESTLSRDDRYSTLDVDASLKASVLCGLVKVEGSAQYLQHSHSSKGQASVTLKYMATTKIQELSLDYLDKIKNKSRITDGTATHVVTAVLYGARAFFIFECDMSEEGSQEKIQGKVEATVNLLLFSIKGEASISKIEETKTGFKNFSSTFYGDFCLSKQPSTFAEAIEIYRSLPTLLGANGENAVPLKVWMLPLTCLDPSAVKVRRHISLEALRKFESKLNSLNRLEVRCNNALRSNPPQHSSSNLEKFKDQCKIQKDELKQRFAESICLTRSVAQKPRNEMPKMFTRHSTSNRIKQWMNYMETEIHIHQFLSRNSQKIKALSSEEQLFEETQGAEHAVCFISTSLGRDETNIIKFLNLDEDDGEENVDRSLDDSNEQQDNIQGFKDEMKRRAVLFKDFAEANDRNGNIKFLIASLRDQAHKGANIYLYEHGLCTRKDFEPPSRPKSVTVSDISHNNVTLRICPPMFGAESVKSFSVEICVSGEDEWKHTTEAAADAAEVSVSELSPDTEYNFRCRAVTSVGVGPAAQAGGPIRTKSI